jgi:hypothetical protein
MSKLLFVTAMSVASLALVPAGASASATAPGVVAVSSSEPGGDPDTTVTFTVTSGALSMSAPVVTDLGSGAPGTTISGSLGPVTVTDDRALLSASWTTTASATDFTTGGGTPAETVPASDAGYDPGSVTTTGTITATGTPITLSGTATPVVTGTDGVGDNTATWDPVLSIAVPASAIGGVYTGTLTQSVS